MHKKVIGDPVVIGGRTLSLSRAIRAGDFIFRARNEKVFGRGSSWWDTWGDVVRRARSFGGTYAVSVEHKHPPGT